MSFKRCCMLAASLILAGCEFSQVARNIESEPAQAPEFIGSPAVARPLAGEVPDYPHMAPQGLNTMHGDSYSSDVHHASGPLGHNPAIQSRTGSPYPGGQCATVTFDRGGRLVALCASVVGFELHLLAPRSLQLLARYRLSMRPSTFEALVKRDQSVVMTDTSGGAYFYLDDEDRAVLVDSRQRLMRVGHRQTAEGGWEFFLADSWQLGGDFVPQDCMNWNNWFPSGECDPATAVMPDLEGNIWWVTRRGRIGTLEPESGRIKMIRLPGEEIQNGFSVAHDGVYIVSDHALYAMKADAEGLPRVIWREQYDRGSAKKVGSINQGSGTTPTLLGEDYITVTDNADERMNLLVYRRAPKFEGERLVCKVPLFESGASATDNSMVAWGRSIFLENNHGYSNAMQQEDWGAVTGGISRIDVREDESGCDTVWTSAEKSPSVVPKLSSGNGLLYFYTFEPQADGQNAWYLLALDAQSGETAFKIRTGVGMNYDNNWAPISIGPDGTLYVGTFKGLVAIWDQE
ncbi:hypothetical protein HBA55_15720 [Pseudomaricurvus alkylphenolicus]|uniref:hypothetical protein n=1 Tax=Pseudomaricurvus alkylphenolicus TaxID=1306991 RepID=UPI001420B8A7|nr:hypothetical protein [Pseudomaricurvus alkylphenolicus]NIB41052.1 hypothetical protein [Pseudomaricurvus alkylphenolicus]